MPTVGALSSRGVTYYRGHSAPLLLCAERKIDYLMLSIHNFNPRRLHESTEVRESEYQ